MRRVRLVVVLLVVVFLVLPLSIRLLMEIPAVQQRVGRELAGRLQSELGSRVCVGHVGLSWGGALSVGDIRIYDRQDSLMVGARRLDLGLDWAALLGRGRVILSQARLFESYVRVYRPTEGAPLNIAFALDKLSAKPDAEPSLFAINTILFRRARIDYRPTPSSRHYMLSDVGAKVRLLQVEGGKVRADVRHLSFRELSGFVLKDLSGKLDLSGRELRIRELSLLLPDTRLRVPSIRILFPKEGGSMEGFGLQVDIADSYIRPSDLAPLYGPLADLTERLSLDGRVVADAHRLDIPAFSARYGNGFRFSVQDVRFARIAETTDSILGVGQLLRRAPVGKVSLYANEEVLQQVKRSLSSGFESLPYPIQSIHHIDLSAEVRESRAGIYQVFGDLLSNIGAVRLDTELTYSELSLLKPDRIKGFLSFTNADLSIVSPQMSDFGAMSADMAFDLRADETAYLLPFRGNATARVADLTYRGKLWHEIQCHVETTGRGWGGSIAASSSEGDVRASMALTPTATKDPEIAFSVDLDRLALSSFVPNVRLSGGLLSCVASGHLSAFTDLDRIGGELQIDTLSFVGQADSVCLGAINIRAEGHPEQGRRISIASEYLKATMGGHFAVSRLPGQIYELALSGTPVLFPRAGRGYDAATDYCAFDISMSPLPESLSRYLGIPVRIVQPIRIGGVVDAAARRLVAKVSSAEIVRGGDLFGNCYAELVANAGRATMLLRTDARVGEKGYFKDMQLTADATADSIGCAFNLGCDPEQKPHGTVRFGIGMHRQPDGHLQTRCRILPSHLFLDQIAWQLSASQILLGRDYLDVDHLGLLADGRSLRIDGRVSRYPEDSLQVALQRINLNYVLHLLGVDFDLLDTDLSGTAVVSDLYGEQRMSAHVESDRFAVNKQDCGAIRARGVWNKHTQLIEFAATVLPGDTAHTEVMGFFRPLGDDAGLDLSFDAHHQPINFVGEFLTGFSSGFGGKATGRVRLHGPFSLLALDGDAMAEDVGITPAFIYTPYILNGRVTFTSHTMQFHDMSVRDRRGRTAVFGGMVGYKPGFDNFSYDVQLTDADRLMVYDVSARQNEMIYGRAFASGSARLFGDDRHGTTLTTNLSTSAGTDLTLDFGRSAAIESKGMLRFVSFAGEVDSSRTKTEQEVAPQESSLPFAMSMHVGATPEAKVRLLLDRKSGDGISGHARGDLRIDLDKDGKYGVFGKLCLVSGTYGFSLEQLLHKNFSLKEGSTITFAGDPMLASLDLSAMYNLTANLADLDESLVAGHGRSNVPVSCILDIDGPLRNPTLSFDIDLPGSDAELRRQMRSLIDAEDMMTRQIAYLVMLGKFYNPATGRPATATQNFASVATSTLAEQLSYLLGGLSEKIQIGTSIKTNNATFDDTDIELLLSSQLFDNRLLINGNFGYRDNPYVRNTYVGEFEIEYKLTPSGNLRLKGYSHYNNMYQYLRQSLTTQGVGILYRKDFNTLPDLIPFLRRRMHPRLRVRDVGVDSLSDSIPPIHPSR